ncbi:ribosomal protein S5 domain 2-like protein [Calocera cornea HHB12733]|uniref:Ribosomal protein S5 domain 2-like protein n=1 Tax=Calocera cornea HHB12733 TaxID=1353952 RepID=A0A165K9I8_9BASI|nr:ribosomal protein S5 domain 2-like protein [Calocera cornea HHB12733]
MPYARTMRTMHHQPGIFHPRRCTCQPVLRTYATSSGSLPEGIQLVVTDRIVHRKSVFVGRACRITDPSQVPPVIAFLRSERRIAKASHPTIYAYRCQVGSVLHHGNDDDGEHDAGGRIAGLLQILDVNNVLVIVTRYFGGTLLGADRFKLISQAAREALKLGGFIEKIDESTKSGKGKK